MSNNGTDNKATITCPKCQQRFSVAPPVPEEPMNALKCSVIVATHEKPVKCPNAQCGQYLVWVVMQTQVVWNILAITQEQADSITESKIIVPDLRLM